LIRDDGSTDGTLAIVRRFARSRPDQIALLKDSSPRLGVCQSFSRLVEHSDADYMVLCDQDDLWLPGRIAKSLARIHAAESEHGASTPVLAHSDLTVVDENLKTIAPSFWRYSRLRPELGQGLNRLLVQNVVTGCATTINRALARLASPIPAAAAPMHDWWLALVAAALGRIETAPDATVLYRQHTRNCLGATRHDARYVMRCIRDALFGRGVSRRFQVARRQAHALLHRYAPRLSMNHQTQLADFLRLGDVSLLRRRRLMLKHRFFGSGQLRNLAWLAMI
jgi:glycosyltransferase involved in cell wall biosynthesis